MAKKKVQSLDLLEPLLVETFGLERLFAPTTLLQEWLSADGALNATDMSLLVECQEKLIENADSWNEEELKMQFISMITFLARFSNPIRTYYDREINAMIGDVFLNCKGDMMLSKGIGEMVKTPYFFLHEYKREKKYSGDPIGQMLGGMLISQAKNNNAKPVYGCYVQGRYWYFCILKDKQYVISNSFNSTILTESQKIIYILLKLKQIILEHLME
ncbi:MAG: hypothetical protein RLZZ292_1190 [Bacteroidota bacterium]|jgi:hypothetical protein